MYQPSPPLPDETPNTSSAAIRVRQAKAQPIFSPVRIDGNAAGIRIFGATLTPFEGANYWTPEGESKRQALNDWIRTGKAYDAVFDFDAAVRDPNRPTRVLAQYDPGDHLHLNAAGYQAVANAIDLSSFRSR